MAIDLNSLFQGYNPTNYGYTQNTDGSKPNGWYKDGAEAASDPYGGGSAFESYLNQNNVSMWDPGNPVWGRVGATNKEAFDYLNPGAQILGQGGIGANGGFDPNGGQMQYYTGQGPAKGDYFANKDYGDHSGINGIVEKVGPMIPLAFAGAAGMGLLGGAEAGLDTLGGGSFMAANDAAMGAGSSIFGGGAGGLSGFAGEGLGAASLGATSAGLADFGVGFTGDSAASGLGIDSSSNPFSFSGGTNNFDGTFGGGGGSSFGGGPGGGLPDSPVNMLQQGNAFDFNSPTSMPQTPGGTIPGTDVPYEVGQNLVNNPQMFQKNISDLVSKYGMDAAKSIYNYAVNQKQKKDLQAAGTAASNVMGQPQRQPFLNEATQIAQGNLGAGGDAIRAAVDAQAQARYAKYGYGGTETSRADVQLAAEMAKYGNDRLNALLGYVGANQQTASVAYQSARDSAIFSGMSYQQFSVLAGKIGADSGAQGAITQAAKDLGNSIMTFFS